MKHLSYYITLMALLALTSCFNDKDEIAHRDFDHVLAVDSIPGESLLVYIGDTLRLSPGSPSPKEAGRKITPTVGSSAKTPSLANRNSNGLSPNPADMKKKRP